MRVRFVILLGVVLSIMACDRGAPVAPASAAAETIDLVPDYAISPAASVDASGVGSSRLPESLRLTPEQKAAIAALHEAFMQATAADVAALRVIEREARAAVEAGKSRDEVRAILAKAEEPQRRVAAAERKLQEAILSLLTPEQRERWICRTWRR